MENKDLEQAIAHLEEILNDFKQAKEKGKATNSNAERAQSISDIEEITRRLETYMQNNGEVLELITDSRIELPREVEWNDVVRPAHFEEDLSAEINNLRKKIS